MPTSNPGYKPKDNSQPVIVLNNTLTFSYENLFFLYSDHVM